ncbi:manganese efflux pump MntP family protein [Sphingomonas solaris]|uniref:Putative manganese efflux pump MntP n=1 Tax=Alterirhizorhabdus solaris TaxID=2529389 RepID=A0A558R328_9SPHN|nr:manganese efflux pump MntP family protein [Sphingomonas solaris]TVV73793.1 manganese efflux pump [Sphingomonas solaris]
MTTLLLLALALAMDAFAVSVAQGAAVRPGLGASLRIALAFGAAQAVMPLLGWGLGIAFAGVIDAVDHWVAFVLLGAIGAKMIHEALADDDGEPTVALSGGALMLAALATSIDAAAAGVTLPTLGVPVGLAVTVIGVVTAALCLLGALAGARIGARIGRTAEIAGGVVLIGLGCRILAQHTGWL